MLLPRQAKKTLRKLLKKPHTQVAARPSKFFSVFLSLATAISSTIQLILELNTSTREAAEVAKDRAAGLTLDDSEIEIFWSKPVDKQIYNTRKQLTKIFSQGMQSGGRMGDSFGLGG